MSLASLQKIVKCAGNNDMVTLRADESVDVLALLFESKKVDRVGEYEMKLMDIDQEHLGIPDTIYDAEISLPSAEFARIIRDLKELGESVKIEVSKEGVRFSADGDIGTAAVTLKPTEKGKSREDSDDEEDGSDEEEGSAAEEEEEEEEQEEQVEEEAEPKEEEDGDVRFPALFPSSDLSRLCAIYFPY
jgi:proliferating cell nuclear antigen